MLARLYTLLRGLTFSAVAIETDTFPTLMLDFSTAQVPETAPIASISGHSILRLRWKSQPAVETSAGRDAGRDPVPGTSLENRR